MSRFLDGLNPAQREAVRHVDGPLLVLAGPGSGKTRVITNRIAYLIEESGVAADAVLGVTFTNKAADEMRLRLESLLPGRSVAISTFHRFSARLLRQYAPLADRDQRFTILQPTDVVRVVAEIMADQGIDTTHLPPADVARRISLLKNELIGPEDFLAHAHGVVDRDIARVYPELVGRLQRQNAVDFDDLLLLVANLLRNHPDVRGRLDARFRYVLVDEYQDTNLAQYAIARGLSIDFPNLCATGDPDQAIYSWRGGNIGNILRFEEDFPGARVVHLEENYRSTPEILAVADHFIRHNRERKHKDLRTENQHGPLVRVFRHRDDQAEAGFVAELIREGVDNGSRDFRDYAVFVRTVALSRSFEQEFKARLIPYQVVGGTAFFDRAEIRDVLAYARLLVNPRDDSAVGRIINRPTRGIGDVSLARLRVFAADRGIRLVDACRQVDKVPGLTKKPKTAIGKFLALLEELSGADELSPFAAIGLILERTQYRQYLLDDENADERLAALNELEESAQVAQFQDPSATLSTFLESMSLTSDSDKRDDVSDMVSIMTLHSAKGLEFPVVFLVALEDKILPHDRAVQEGNDEEERRLAFVGMTRAREELSLSYAARRMRGGKFGPSIPSSFLLELPPEQLDRRDFVSPTPTSLDDDPYANQESGWEEHSIPIYHDADDPSPADRFHLGMWVQHPQYGEGVILAVDGKGRNRRATIQFDSIGPRTFVLASSALTPLPRRSGFPA